MTLPVQELNALLSTYRYLIKRGNEGDEEARMLAKHFPYESDLIERWLEDEDTSARWRKNPEIKREIARFMPSLKRRFPDLLS